MFDILSTLLELAGSVLILFALWMVWVPLAVLAAGLACVAAGFAAGDRR